MTRRQTVLVTGADGNLGRKLTRHLGKRPDIDLRLLGLTPGAGEIIAADLSEYDDRWAAHFAGAHHVIHLAAASAADSSWSTVQTDNIDLSLNVLRAAEAHGVSRLVFASSNWTMAGYRFSTDALSTDIAPWPINPYGASKLFIERAGRDYAARTGRAFIALRIGHCQADHDNRPGPHMQNGRWGQEMWLSDQDMCRGFEFALSAPDVTFAVLNLMSDNRGMRWDIETARAVTGYEPLDHHVPVITPHIEDMESIAAAKYQMAEALDRIFFKY